jgi:hypothetical protein
MWRRLLSSERHQTAQFWCRCLDQQPFSFVNLASTGRYWLEHLSPSYAFSEEQRPCCCASEHTPSPMCSSRPESDHNSAGEWAAHGPPGGQCLPMRLKTRQDQRRVERHRVQPLERLLERLPEQRAVQRRMRLVIPVETQVANQVQTRVPTPVATQSSIRPVVHRDTPREIQGTLRRVFRGAFVAAFSCEFPGTSYQESSSGSRPLVPLLTRSLVSPSLGGFRLSSIERRSADGGSSGGDGRLTPGQAADGLDSS